MDRWGSMVACNLEIFGAYGNIIETEDFSRSAVEEVEHGCPLNYMFEAVSGCLGACGWGTHGTGCQRTFFFSDRLVNLRIKDPT